MDHSHRRRDRWGWFILWALVLIFVGGTAIVVGDLADSVEPEPVTGNANGCPAGFEPVSARSELAPIDCKKIANFHVSASGNDQSGSNDCRAEASPCLTLNRALQSAKGGDVVDVSGDFMSPQIFSTTSALTGYVTFRAASGRPAIIDSLDTNGADWLAFENLIFQKRAVNTFVVNVGSSHIRLRDVKIYGALRLTGDVSDVAIIGGEVGDYQANNSDPQIGQTSSGQAAPTNVLIDGVWFHDIRGCDLELSQCPDGYTEDSHTECLQVTEFDGLFVRNSRFGPTCGAPKGVTGFSGAGFRITPGAFGGLHRSLIFENNSLDEVGGIAPSVFTTSLQSNGLTNADDWIIHNNRALGFMGVGSAPDAEISVSGNIMLERQGTCSIYHRGRWNYNHFETGPPCGTNATTGPSRKFPA